MQNPKDNRAVIIPIKVDAMLVKPGDGLLAEAKVDFSRLPFNNGKEDVNSEFAYISENFLSQPFQNQNLELGLGVHLHWALPDAFTKGEMGKAPIHDWLNIMVNDDPTANPSIILGTVRDYYSGAELPGTHVMVKGTNNGTITDLDGKFQLNVKEGHVLRISFNGYTNKDVPVFPGNIYSIKLVNTDVAGPLHVTHPPVPDRWVINRKKNNEIEKSWVVESNYLHPEGRDNNYSSIAYPIEVTEVGQPFRYMGRSYCFFDSKRTSSQPTIPKLPPKAAYLKDLTAVGYGEHTFAAFYPNCHSVFGFHDPEVKNESDLNAVEYEVMGWYSDPITDPVQLIEKSTNDYQSSALSFDGKDDYVNLGNTQIIGNSKTFTIELWVNMNRLDNSENDHPIYGEYLKSDNSTANYLAIQDNGQVRLDQFPPWGGHFRSKNKLKAGRWYYIAYVRESHKEHIYIDGSLDISREEIEPIPTGMDQIWIGARGGHSISFFDGQMLDFRLWNIARNQDEIKSSMYAELESPQDGLVAFYKFNQGIAGGDNSGKTVLVDSSGNANHGTLSNFELKGQNSNWVKGSPTKHLSKVLKKQFNFDLKAAPNFSGQHESLMSLCFGKIHFSLSNKGKKIEVAEKKVDSITIGNTGTEALSALLSEKFDKDSSDKKLIEKELEALQLGSKLSGKRLDIGPAFEEAYHEKGFSTINGGHIWSLHLISVASKNSKENNIPNGNKPAGSKKQGVEITLPESLANWLNEVNLLQQKYDRDQDELKSLQQSLYADWSKYMISSYHPDFEKGLPQMDDVRFFIENNSIPKVKQKKAEIQVLQQQINEELTQINQLVTQFNSGLASHEKQITEKYFYPDYKTPADRFHPDETTPEEQRDNDLEGVFVQKYVERNGTNPKIFDHTEGETIAISNDSSKPFIGLSFWVNISSHQPADPTTGEQYKRELLKIVNPADATAEMAHIDTDGFDQYWQSVYINGMPLDPYQVIKWKTFPKDQWIHVYLMGASAVSQPVNIVMMNGLKGSLAGVRVYHTGLTAMEVFLDQNMLLLKELKLVRDKGPRYWQPNEPVVLISGDVAAPTDRHGSDGELPCLLFDGSDLAVMDDPSFFSPSETKKEFNPEPFRELLSTIKDFAEKINTQGVSFPNFITEYTRTQSYTKPWNPIILDWKVGISPLFDEGGLSNYTLPENFITQNYLLEDDKPDLIPHPDHGHTSDSIKIFSGSTILTPHSKLRMKKVIESYLENLHEDHEDWDNYGGTKPNPFKNPFVKPEGVANPNFPLSPDYEISTDDTISIALKAYHSMGEDQHFLSQSFGGFNAAMQMLHQTFQLPIADPIGFKDDQTFASKVKDYVAQASTHAPLPLFEFDPIRTGKMKLLELNIIDTFGQVAKVYEDGEMNTLSVYSRALEDGKLLPRISQPARLNFRWLSAKNDGMEMNEHPASSPVCGWLVPNNIDRSIIVYDQEGYSLGAIQLSTKTRTEAHRGPIPDITKIGKLPNKHLQTVVDKISVMPDLPTFMDLLEKTMDGIDPENFAQHTDLAMLMGRPIAIVRASVGLEVKGGVAINQSWEAFTNDMTAFLKPEKDQLIKRSTNDWEKVKFPIRIGEHGQFNDGVLGYWLDTSPDMFLSTVPIGDETISDSLGHNTNSLGYNATTPKIMLSPSDAPVRMTLLMDPRGKAHAICGALPAKLISIPDDQFKPAMKNMSVTFFTRPLLTPENKLAIPLPDESGYSWSWLEKRDGRFTEISTIGIVHKESFTSSFKNGNELWEELLKKGWIDETENDKARVMPKNHRKDSDPKPLLITQLSKIQDILDAGHIVDESYEPDFTHKNKIKEGWLKLTPND